jgi:hypothetical protein
MPDISMCANKECALRMECYRYRAVPNPYRQSWSNFSPTIFEGMALCCDYQWPLKDATTKLNSIETMENYESKQDPEKIMGS